jgi:hypothetical protein
MTIKDGDKVLTLEELAQRICNSYDECDDCPAAGYCRHGHTGMIDWLREVLE